MNRDIWMAVRAYLPAAVAILAAFALLELAGMFDQQGMLADLGRMLRWGSAGAMALGGILFVHTSVRLYRADLGKGLLCDCGGLLGREIDGRYGPYRRCLRCSRNVPRRQYEMHE